MSKSAESSDVHERVLGSDPAALEGWSVEAPRSTVRPTAQASGAAPGRLVGDDAQRNHDAAANEGAEPRWMRDLRSFVSAKRAAIAAGDVESGVDEGLARESFRRIGAPVFSRPAGLRLFSRTTRGIDSRIPFLRIYTDDAFSVGGRLRLEVYVEGRTYKIDVEVAWLDPLPESAPARFDMGLFVNDADPESATAIVKILRKQPLAHGRRPSPSATSA